MNSRVWTSVSGLIVLLTLTSSLTISSALFIIHSQCSLTTELFNNPSNRPNNSPFANPNNANDSFFAVVCWNTDGALRLIIAITLIANFFLLLIMFLTQPLACMENQLQRITAIVVVSVLHLTFSVALFVITVSCQLNSLEPTAVALTSCNIVFATLIIQIQTVRTVYCLLYNLQLPQASLSNAIANVLNIALEPNELEESLNLVQQEQNNEKTGLNENQIQSIPVFSVKIIEANINNTVNSINLSKTAHNNEELANSKEKDEYYRGYNCRAHLIPYKSFETDCNINRSPSLRDEIELTANGSDYVALKQEEIALDIEKNSFDSSKTQANLATIELDSEACCSICYDSFLPEDQVSQLPVCRHLWHTACIAQWFRLGNTTCPLDRSEIAAQLQQQSIK
jgi:hypothetical protein